MLNTLINKAISAALHANWQEAISINLEILSQQPQHIPTLNRLAKAYFELGDFETSQKYYQNVLVLDRYNSIALKNSKLRERTYAPQHTPVSINLNFIEEPGKTKTLTLTRLGDPKILTALLPGQVVQLVIKNHAICVCTDNQDHIGALTDDVAYTLKHAIELGNKYLAIVKVGTPTKVTIFIREIYRDERLKDTPTFTYHSFS